MPSWRHAAENVESCWLGWRRLRWRCRSPAPLLNLIAPIRTFDGLGQALSAASLARPVVVLDLDRIDHNLAEIRQALGNDAAYRATTKSLPSYELLRHVLSSMHSQRLMDSTAPICGRSSTTLIDGPALVPGTAQRLDILLGKPLPASELEAFYAAPPAENKLAATRLRWLVDHEGSARGLSGNCAAPIPDRRSLSRVDVGLHRGAPAITRSCVGCSARSLSTRSTCASRA